MDVTERSSNGEHGTNLGESLVDRKDLFGGSVQLFGIDVFVVDAILFSTGDSDFHFEPDLHGDHAFEVFSANLNILLIGFLGQVKHVRREEWLA